MSAALLWAMFAARFGKSEYLSSYPDVQVLSWRLRYTENYVTEAEFNVLPPRLQEQVKRAATHNNASGAAWNMYYNTPAPNRYKRVGELSV